MKVSRARPLLLALAIAVTGCPADPSETTTEVGTDSTGDATTADPSNPTSGTPTSAGPTTGATTTTGETTTADPSTTTGVTATTTTGDPETTTTDTSTDTSTSDSTTSDTTGGNDLLQCPEVIDQAIVACVAELQQDPDLGDKFFLLDMLLACADAEPVAVTYDAYCADAPADPICALDYAEFVSDVLPECTARAQATVFAEVCLLPEFYRDLLVTPSITLLGRRFITDPAQLDATEAEQLLHASGDMGFPADSVEAALAATDDAGFEQLTVLDIGTDRVLVAYSAHYGDTRVGRVYFQYTQVIVGAIEDSTFTRCGVERTIEGQPCQEPATCGPGFQCYGIVPGPDPDEILGLGVCVDPTVNPNDGSPCQTHSDCDPQQTGLVCLGLGYKAVESHCRPGWMRHSFTTPLDEAALIAGGVTIVPILVSGLATVPTTGFLDLTLGQLDTNGLTIRLRNPGGTDVLVFDTSGNPTTDIVLNLHEVPVPSDESVNGVWTLEIHDAGGNASGGVYALLLTLDSRWD